MHTGLWKITLTALLSLIYISSCVQIEIRDKRPYTPRPKEPPRPTEPVKELPKEPAKEVPKDKPEEQKRQIPKDEYVKVAMPVKGTPVKAQRGYFIRTSCDEFFRSVEEGRVLYAGDDLKNYGWVIMIEQRDGYMSVYTRAENSFVKKGERVRKAQVLGKVGKQGNQCGIGFELRLQDGSPINFEFIR